MREQLRALITRHCTTLAHEYEALTACLVRLDAVEREVDGSDGSSSDLRVLMAVREGFELAHKIKGSSGSLGFAAISAAAGELENHLKAVERATVSVTDEEVGKAIKAALGALGELIRDVAPEQSALYNVNFPEGPA